MPRATNVALSLIALAAAAAASNAAVVSVTGQALIVPAPPTAVFGSFTGGVVHVWDEQQSINVGGLPVDLSINPSSSTLPTAGAVSGLIDSHFLHYNDWVVPVSGTVTFNNPIIGVAYNDVFLNISDPVGAFGTLYPTGDTWRGINTIANPGASIVSISGNTLTFHFEVVPGAPDFDQVRVFTRVVPTPGSLALLGVGGLMTARRRRA